MYGKKTNVNKRWMIVMLFVMGCFGCSLLPIWAIQRCNQLDETPVIDVYPDSILTDQSEREFTGHHRVTYEYVTDANVADVISFFDATMVCTVDAESHSGICQNRLENRNGEYFVYFNFNQQDEQGATPTMYAVEVSWEVCDWSLDISS
jgi:hypothetical protein